MSTLHEGIPLLEAGQRLSRAEFLRRWQALPTLKKAELLGGVVYMPSPVSRLHAQLTQDVGACLAFYRAQTPGCAGGSDGTWFMAGEETPQPDNALWILPDWGGQSTSAGNYCAGAPELVVEITLSSSTYDRRQKREIYRAGGVQEYVLVLPEEHQILWQRLTNGQYQLVEAAADGIWRAQQFPGLWLDGEALLELNTERLLMVVAHGLASAEHQRFVEQLRQRRTGI